jgi:hypothetical protein
VSVVVQKYGNASTTAVLSVFYLVLVVAILGGLYFAKKHLDRFRDHDIDRDAFRSCVFHSGCLVISGLASIAHAKAAIKPQEGTADGSSFSSSAVTLG